VYVLRVMTHTDYDREDWPAQCGCYQPQPERSRPARRQPRMKKQTVKRRGT
jgi:hypothetical protein